MHFWIDKRSQGCVLSRRHLGPSTLSGCGRNQRFICGGLHPKPMVTPVHRFQSIESVANNSLRIGRSSGYHYTRNAAHYQPTIHYSGVTSSVRSNPQMGRSLEMLNTGHIHNSTVRQNIISSKAKLRCCVWMIFAIVTFFLTFFLTGAKYIHGMEFGMAFVFWSILLIFLIIGAIGLLFEGSPSTANETRAENVTVAPVVQPEVNIQNNQVPNSLITPTPVSAELSPPAYHIAILLPSHNDAESMRVICDSPPPSYEKVVT